MKNIAKYFIFAIMIFFPFFVKAASYLEYNDAVISANKYIEKSQFSSKNKYLLFKDGLYDSSVFKKGGLLSKKEYLITLRNGYSYLSPGNEYWTLTGVENDSNKQYIITNKLETKDKEDASYIRVTEYVQSGVKVKGKGTYSNPWIFEKSYLVNVKSNNVNYGTINGEEGVSLLASESDRTVKFLMKVNHGYKYVETQGCNISNIGTIEVIDEEDSENNNETQETANYAINNVSSDMNCLVVFKERTYKYILDTPPTGEELIDENNSIIILDNYPQPNAIYLVYSRSWYSDSNGKTKLTKITPPSLTGYTFDGYYTEENGEGTKVIDRNGNILSGKTTIPADDNEEQRLYSYFIPNTYIVEYDKNDANAQGTMSNSTHQYGISSELRENAYTLEGYEFKEWNTKKDGSGASYGNQEQILNLSIGTKVTLYAQWKSIVPNSITLTVNGAVKETITYVDVNNSENTGKITTNTKAKAIDVNLLPGTYTFKSNVAKETSDRTAEYVQEVIVTTQTTVINFYPVGAIYWYGNGQTENTSLYTKTGGIGKGGNQNNRELKIIEESDNYFSAGLRSPGNAASVYGYTPNKISTLKADGTRYATLKAYVHSYAPLEACGKFYRKNYFGYGTSVKNTASDTSVNSAKSVNAFNKLNGKSDWYGIVSVDIEHDDIIPYIRASAKGGTIKDSEGNKICSYSMLAKTYLHAAWLE